MPNDIQNIYLLPINGVIGQDFKYTDVLMHLNAAKNNPIIKLIIDSPGGYIDEGEKIRQALEKSGKIFYSANSGDVASYAVSLFLVAPKQNRKYDPAKGEFVIHMPFVAPDGGVSGTADEIEMAAKNLKKLQSDIVKQYVQATGADSNIIEGFMNENKPLTTEQVEGLGFAQIEKHELKAVAFYKLNNIEMDNNEVKEKLGVLETLMNKVMNLIRPKNLMIQDVTGVELDFGEAVKTPEEIIAGVKATVDGAPANGDYTLEDGTVYKFEAGVLLEIVLPTAGETELLKKENEQLKLDIAAAKSEIAAAQSNNLKIAAEVKAVNKEFIAFKNQFSTGDTPPAVPDGAPKPKNGVSKDEFEKYFNN